MTDLRKKVGLRSVKLTVTGKQHGIHDDTSVRRGKKSRGVSSRAAAVATAIFVEPASAYHLSYCITILQFLFEISFLPV